MAHYDDGPGDGFFQRSMGPRRPSKLSSALSCFLYLMRRPMTDELSARQGLLPITTPHLCSGCDVDSHGTRGLTGWSAKDQVRATWWMYVLSVCCVRSRSLCVSDCLDTISRCSLPTPRSILQQIPYQSDTYINLSESRRSPLPSSDGHPKADGC
jgi:hypothetical protein